MLTLDHVSKVYKVGTFGGKELTARPRRKLRGGAGRGRVADRRERQRQEHDRQDDPHASRPSPRGRSPSTGSTSQASGVRR